MKKVILPLFILALSISSCKKCYVCGGGPAYPSKEVCADSHNPYGDPKPANNGSYTWINENGDATVCYAK